MVVGSKSDPQRILIVSSHPLFSKGLRKLLMERREADVVVVGVVSSVDEAISALDAAAPDLVVVDYDDERVNRDEFLARFVEGNQKLRVVLLSLKEGGSEAVVYDRRMMAASQIDDWLKVWQDATGPVRPARGASITKMRRKIFDSRALKKITSLMDNRSSNMKHFFAAVLLVFALAVALLIGLSEVELLPVAASLQAGPIDRLFNFHFVAITLLFSLIVGFMLYSIIVFRRRGDDDTDAAPIEGSTRLEIIWTAVPLAVVIYISVLGAFTLADIERPEYRPVVVDVIASQWSWRFEYPDDGVVSNELVLPVNKQALLRLSSTDVIHSFWVPEFRVKQDMLPGGEDMVREVRITPNLEGDYKVRCAEMCGRLHADMLAPVRVVPVEEYVAWIDQQAEMVNADPVERGQQLSQQYGCLSCHSVDGSEMVGPTWEGLFGSERPLESGEVVVADEVYLHESIVDPDAQVVSGFPNIMPPTGEQMTDEELAAIIEFIKSLE